MYTLNDRLRDHPIDEEELDQLVAEMVAEERAYKLKELRKNRNLTQPNLPTPPASARTESRKSSAPRSMSNKRLQK